jgi:hypothetical protein
VATAKIRQALHRFRGSAILSGDALLEKFPQQARDAGVMARRLDSDPLSHVFFKGYSYVS